MEKEITQICQILIFFFFFSKLPDFHDKFQ